MVPTTQKVFIPPTPGASIFVQGTEATYTIGQLIGEGHFAYVYACKDEWNNDLAAKVLKPLGSHTQVGQLGAQEIQKLLAVRHPHITYLYDAFEFQNAFYLITERCHQSLHDLFANRTIQLQPLLSIARCVLQAVDFIHRQGFVHQDIHTGNVFLTFARDGHGKKPLLFPTSSYKLGDLGVAKPINEVGAAHTRGWMPPPEVIDSSFGPPNHRIDIYHAAVLLLQVACGEEMRFAPQEIVKGKPREIVQTLRVPPAVKVAIDKALRRRVTERTPSAKQFWRDLNATS
jgi:serine/threonine protein kinase